MGSRGSSVGIATGYGLDDRGVGVRVPSRIKRFHSSPSRPGLGPTQLSDHWVQGAFSSGVKQPGHEAHRSPPTSVEVKKTWICPSTATCLHGVVLS
jgi:hypothetical protein